jgi:AraC family transcriptional regulator
MLRTADVPTVAPESFRCAAAIPSARCDSSRDVGWKSLLLDHHTSISCCEGYTSIATPDQVIGVATTGRYTSEALRDGRWRRGVYEPGSICVHRPGEAIRLRFPALERASFRTALVYLPYAQIQAAADHFRHAGQRTAKPAIDTAVNRDPAISQMVASLIGAMENSVDDLYAQTAASWLAVHLVTRHGPNAAVEDDRGAGLISDARLARVVEYMSVHFAEPLTLDELAAEACISKFHFTRLFRRKIGQTPHGLLTKIRLETARRLLITSDMPISEIGKACGYPDSSNFSSSFAARHGVAPSTFRARRNKH